MIQALSLNEFLMLSEHAKRIAVFTSLPLNTFNAFDIYQKFSNDLSDGVILEDLYQKDNSAFSYLLFEPFATFKVKQGIIEEKIHDKVNIKQARPFRSLRNFQEKLSFVTRSDAAHLISSSAGFIAYDAVRYIEVIPDRHEIEPTIPDILFHFYKISITLNHANNQMILSVIAEVTNEPKKDYEQAKLQLDIFKALLDQSTLKPSPTENISALIDVQTDVNQDEFMAMVEKAKEHIVCGNIFQIVLSRCFKTKCQALPISIYEALREISPSPYLFYFPFENNCIVGASPERLIKVHFRKITSNPIAGTRKRSGEKNDAEIEMDLLSDEKEIAEHMMLVDLARNDIGAISIPGTVKVEELLTVKHYSHVSHITSLVTGELKPDLDSLDVLTASFPAGTLSGAPKIRAMQIIDELETSRRGLYGGAICRFDYAGNLDSAIAIRMALLKEGEAIVRAGAGIVYDSDPLMEAYETEKKANAILLAIKKAHGVI